MKLNLSTFHYTSFPKVGQEVLLNRLWEQGRSLKFQTIRAMVLSVGRKQIRVRTRGHKRYTLFADPERPYTTYTNPKR